MYKQGCALGVVICLRYGCLLVKSLSFWSLMTVTVCDHVSLREMLAIRRRTNLKRRI